MAHAPAARRAVLPDLLARHGYRLTGPRRAILDTIAASTAPLTVAEIHARLGTGLADRVSVYRTVNLLLKVGLLRTADVTRAGARYELNEAFTGHHHHVICQVCGRIEDLDGCLLADDLLARLRRQVRQTMRFRVTEHELRLFGLCRQCQA